MTANPEKLGEILITIKDMELARLAGIVSLKEKQLALLKAMKDERLLAWRKAADAPVIPPSRLLSSDDRWRRWVDVELRKINAELARLAALEEEQRLRAATALGKVGAFEKMMGKMRDRRPRRQ